MISKTKYITVTLLFLLMITQDGSTLSLLGFGDTASEATSQRTAASAEIANEQLTNIGTTLDELLQVQQEMKNNSQQYTFLMDVKSFIDLINVISNTICTFEHLSVMMQRNSGGMSNCLVTANYNYYMIDLNAAVDVIKTITTSMKSMSNGERISNFKNALDLMRRANAGLSNMTYAFMLSEQRARSSQRLANSKASVAVVRTRKQSFI